LDWSEDGATDVVIKIRTSSSSHTRNMTNEPQFELDYNMTNLGRVHFERIEDVGYFYINDEFITTIEYNIQLQTRAISIPVALHTQPEHNDIAPFSNWYYWGYDNWVIRQVKSMTEGALTSAINAAILGCLAVGEEIISFIGAAGDLADIFQFLASTVDCYGLDIHYVSRYTECDILQWYGVEPVVFSDGTYTVYDTEQDTFQKSTTHY